MVDARFFDRTGEIDLSQLLAVCGLKSSGYSITQLRHIVSDAAPLISSTSDQVSFAAQKKYLSQLQNSKAGIILVSDVLISEVPASAIAVVCDDPYAAFVKFLVHMFPSSGHHLTHRPDFPHMGKAVFEKGVLIDNSAVIGSGVEIGRDSIIGPNTVIAAGVKIGRNTIVADNVSIECALVGDNVTINSGVRVGAKGFGWLGHGSSHTPVPQLGRVILQSHVEIGPNTTIDRGALGDTIIGENTKIGAMSEIGHNTIIGSNCLLAPMAGLAGSTILEDGVLMGADSGSAGHLRIGAGSILHARCAVSKDWPPGSMLAGAPAQDIKEYWREQAKLRKLLKGLNK